ncbi:hypothetical protein K435DRAFT_877906 [Dendrothele bispora CBS 962.96]|uniref:Uncharacterized protein n=1 Tax=Dendrothele bispora (strain CBS 962.96) TaxID=1314807 RepID=A0A4S8KQ24_DENBC|nr:hypothetical protein K435DRAFT_877906 [Dendrothele bispora CBS 962.96]
MGKNPGVELCRSEGVFHWASSLIDLFRGSSSSSPVTFPSLRRLSLIDINFHPLQNWRTENPTSPSSNEPHHHLNISSSSNQQPLTIPPLVHHRPKLQFLELSSIIPELLDPLFLADSSEYHPGPVFDLSELRHLKVTNSSLYRYRRVFLEYGERIRELEMDFPALMNDSVASTLLPLTNLTHLTLHSCLYANQFHSIPSLIPNLPRHQYLTITSRFPSYARSNSNFIHPRNDNVTSTPIKNILTGILDEELMKVFELETHSGITDQGRLLDPDDDDSSSRVVSGGSYGGGTTSESSSSSAPVVITSRARARPERISFVFEFPAIHPSTTTGSESVVKIQKDEGCLPKTRRVIDIDVVCKTMFY